MQDKSKGRHGGSTKPEGFYTGKDKHYVYGDNTPRKKGNAINILFYVFTYKVCYSNTLINEHFVLCNH